MINIMINNSIDIFPTVNVNRICYYISINGAGPIKGY
jgi:hypothetical protein